MSYAYAIHELQYVDGDVKKTVAPGTVVSLSKDIFNDFFGLNAVRAATEDEVKVAKASGAEGVVETPVTPTDAEIEAAKEAAAREAAARAAAEADKTESERVAREADAAREAAKKPAAKPAAKPDPLA